MGSTYPPRVTGLAGTSRELLRANSCSVRALCLFGGLSGRGGWRSANLASSTHTGSTSQGRPGTPASFRSVVTSGTPMTAASDT